MKVDLVGKDNADIKDDFIQQVPTGKGPPDIAMGAHDWLGELSTNASSPPRSSSATPPPTTSRSRSTPRPTRARPTCSPYAVENIAVLRNADLVPEPAANFDDMIAKGTAAGLTQPSSSSRAPRATRTTSTRSRPPSALPSSARRPGYDPADLQIGNAGGEQFAQWLSGQGKNGTGVFNTDIDGDIAKDSFLTGKSAFWLTGPWNVGAAVDAGINVAIDPVPSPTADPASPFAGVKGFFISAESKNKVAANDFLVNYLGTEDVQLELFKAGNVLPALSAAAETASADPIIAGFAAVGDQAVPMPAIPAMGAVWQYWGIAQAEIINGADPPVATWQKLTSDVQAAISK